MGVASLVLGIISIIFSFIPVLNLIMIITAGVSIALGIGDMIEKSRKKEKFGKSIAGVILSVVSLLIIGIVTFLSFVVAGAGIYHYNIDGIVDRIQTHYEEYEDYDFDSDYEYYRYRRGI